MSEIEIIERTYDDLHWSFRGDPTIDVGSIGYRTETVDPHPGNAHDIGVVRRMARQVSQAFPVDIPVSLTVSPYESLSRTNGWTSVEADYNQEKDASGQYPMVARICFSGKRIAIHPALTRYLVAHEYGHVVEEVLNRARGGKVGTGELLTEYAALRGLTKPREYSGRTHNQSPGEVFANDFRLLICGVECEFWPHPTVARPETLPGVQEWWSDRLVEVGLTDARAA